MLRSDSATPIDDRVTAAITVNRKPNLDRFGTIAATVAWLFYYGRRHDDENVADPWRGKKSPYGGRATDHDEWELLQGIGEDTTVIPAPERSAPFAASWVAPVIPGDPPMILTEFDHL
mgnify:CR=1 FL=1